MDKNEFSADGDHPIDKANNNNHKDDKVNKNLSSSSSSSSLSSPRLFLADSQSLPPKSLTTTCTTKKTSTTPLIADFTATSCPVSFAYLRLLKETSLGSAMSAATASRGSLDGSNSSSNNNSNNRKSGSKSSNHCFPASSDDYSHLSTSSKEARHRGATSPGDCTTATTPPPTPTGSFGHFAGSAIEDRIQALFSEQRRQNHKQQLKSSSEVLASTVDDDEVLDLKVRTKRVKTENGSGELALSSVPVALLRQQQDRISNGCNNVAGGGGDRSDDNSVSNSSKKPGAFPCTQCHKTFSAEVDLKAHLQRHITQHPFVCLACGKGFKYEHSLNFHIKSYHGASDNSAAAHSAASGGVGSAVGAAAAVGLSSSSSAQCLKSFNKKLSRSRRGLGGATNNHNGGGLLCVEDVMMNDEIATDDEPCEDANNNGHQHHSQHHSLHASDLTMAGSANKHEHVDLGFPPNVDLGFPPNVVSKGIQIKSEKGLITMLEGVHSQSDQPYSLYKCCLCGFAFPCLEPMVAHIQLMHSSSSSNLTCDKCGACFKWRSELQLHEHIHTAMEQQQQQQSGGVGSATGKVNIGTNSQKPQQQQLLMPSFLQAPNLALLSPYLADRFTAVETNNCNNSNSHNSKNLNGSSGSSEHSSVAHIGAQDEGLNLSLGLNLTNYASVALIKKDTEKLGRSLGAKDDLVPVGSGNGGNKRKVKQEPRRSPAIDSSDEALSLLKENPFQPKLSSTLGEIEETAPGQFKCRFCDKTFDRIFSVHRHERVHTGYKPCICKVCGRGFSEKRNLRHHIIRFHSDGSGRELLKRARKDKTLSATTKQLAASVLKKAALKYLNNNEADEDNENHQPLALVGSGHRGQQQAMSRYEPEVKVEVEEDMNEENEMSEQNGSENEATSSNGNQNDHSDNSKEHVHHRHVQHYLQATEASSSRRRKSKPSKKMSIENVLEFDEHDESEVDEAERELEVDEEAEDNPESKVDRAALDDEETNDIEKDLVRIRRHAERDGDLSSDSYGGNHSENSVEGSLGKLRNHGAFFSSYSPRLGIVEKPIKRNEACRPLMGPDGKCLYPCGYCQKTFCSLSDLNRHMNFHEDVRPFKCEYCDYQSRTNSQLKVHMMRHAGIKQFLCQVCNYNGVTQSDLNRHCKTRSHVLRSANVCPLCSLGFSTRTLLEDHLVKFHDASNQAAAATSALCLQKISLAV